MELTKRRLRGLRRQIAQPVYPIDERLVELSAAADASGGGVYEAIRNPASHLIYSYLTECMVAALQTHTDKPLSSLRILDWGGGKGYVAYFLQQKGISVTLYETDDFPHRALWQSAKLTTKTSDGTALPFAAGTFDAVVGFGVLEHVPYDYEWLKEINRVLKDDGLFFCFNLPNKTGYVHHVTRWRGVRYHDRLYSRKEITQLLKRAGFNTIGKPWFRQLLPKTRYRYPRPRMFERADLLLTNYTPLRYLAASIEFVARKQYAYTAKH